MKKLIRIRVVQFFLYEMREVDVGMSCGIFGANGSGKSSLLDAVQIVMLGANESRGSAGVAFNAQADESNHNSRNIRSYCLGQYGDSPEARVRDSANTYITLVWEDTATREIVSTGVSIYVSADREKSDVQGRYILPAELTLNDHLEFVDGEYRSRPWASFRQMLSQRAYGEEVLFHDSERFVNAMLFRLRGVRENQERIAKGKPPLEGPAAALKRVLANAGVDATPVCDLVRVDDSDWQPAIESYLGTSNMQALLVDEADERKAFRVSRQAVVYEAKVVMPSKFSNRGSPRRGAVAELISGNSVAAVNYLRSKFGDTQRADTEDECFTHRFAMTKDGMLLADGEMVRKKPTDPALFKIGPTSTATRTSIAERARQLEEQVEALKDRYAKLKVLLTNLSPFVGGEQDKVLDILEAFDRLSRETNDEAALTQRLQALDTEEYRQLVQATAEADAAVTALRELQLETVQAVGAAETESPRESRRPFGLSN